MWNSHDPTDALWMVNVVRKKCRHNYLWKRAKRLRATFNSLLFLKKKCARHFVYFRIWMTILRHNYLLCVNKVYKVNKVYNYYFVLIITKIFTLSQNMVFEVFNAYQIKNYTGWPEKIGISENNLLKWLWKLLLYKVFNLEGVVEFKFCRSMLYSSA